MLCKVFHLLQMLERSPQSYGPSGCGKSTLLYLLGLLDRPDEGDILLKHQSVATANDQVRTKLRNEKVGFIFQFHFLIKELTACENVSMPLLKARIEKVQANKKASLILKAWSS